MSLRREIGLTILSALLPAVAGCAGGSAQPVPTPTLTPVPLGPLPSRVRLPAGSAAPFAIEGDTLVWAGIPKQRGVCPRNDLYLGNVRAWHPRVIWKGPQCGVISDVRISRSWIVWAAGASPAGSIWAKRRAGGPARRVSGQAYPPLERPCPTPSCFPNLGLALMGNVAVWSHTDLSPSGDIMTSEILGRTLPNGPVKTLFATTGACQLQTAPAVAGRRLVWLVARWPHDVPSSGQTPPRQCAGTLQTDVMTERLGRLGARRDRLRPTSAAAQLTSVGSAVQPLTNGRFIAWQDAFGAPAGCVCTALHLYDTGTGIARKIAASTVDFKLSGRLLVWLARLERVTSVRALSLGNPPRPQGGRSLAVSEAPPASRFIRVLGWPWGNRLVWEVDDIAGTTSAAVDVVIRDVQIRSLRPAR